MSNNESPAGGPGGPVTVPALDDLPERMRVHALARRLARTSREVLAALAGLGIEVRSAQSSVERKVAEQVAAALAPSAEQAAEPSEPPEAERADTAPAEAGAEPGAPLAPVFAPPAPLFQAPKPKRRPAPAAAERSDEDERGAAEEAPPAATAAPDEDTDESDETAGRRRRRRGRRGRGRGRGADGAEDDTTEEASEEETAEENGEPQGQAEPAGEENGDTLDEGEAEEAGEPDGETAGTRRRRRRRRRRGTGDDGAEATDETDPPNTVTKLRVPREQRDDEGDGVQSVRGSTRLEAKRQRRRDGRDAGRRRVPILSEAEFLARRESVERSMVVREHGDRVEIAVLEDDVLVEHFVAGRDGGSMVGNIYFGRVQNVLPSMEAAFVDIGRGRNAVLYAGEVDWDAAGLGGKQRRIEQALTSGDSVLVQVTKDPIGHKGARLTTQISLAGRFLVYVPSGGAAGISRKLPDVERKRLKEMLKEIVPSEAGVIIRTASEGVSHEALERDVRRLQAQWEVIKGKAEQTGPNKPKAPVLLYEEPDLLIKVVRDQFNEDFSRLVIEGDDAWDTLSNYVGHVAPELADRMHRHVGPKDVFAEYGIDDQLLKALDRKVWLPSGGTLVIDRTEAMTVIDVNTGKFTGSGGNLEETVTRNNLEAAEEIVRQLRLRDIGGIIVIDFIDMVLEANRDLVLRRLTECLARDRTRHQVAEVTSLGLVQMTRKRVGGGLLEHFSTPCEHCRGRGVIVDTEPAAGPHAASRHDRFERPEREGRRPRGRGRRDGEDRNGGDRNGSDVRKPERKPEPALAGPAAGGAAARNGRSVEAASAEASIEVGAATPVVTPAVLDAPVGAPEAEAPAAEAPAADAASVDAAAVDESAVEEAGPASRRIRRSARREPVEVSPEEGPADVVADAVEEAVVERTAAAALSRPQEESAQVEAGVTAGEPGGRRPRRRGRVTRTAGAPTATVGDAPAAAVVTIPSTTVPSTPEPSAESATTAVVPPQPAPAPPARPRRARRAASRPAGPPAAEEAGDPE
jgi:ribonuclease E